MGRFYGAIGYAQNVETTPGVWEEVLVERNYYGDINKISRRLQSSGNANDDVTVNHHLSILADQFAYENFHNIRYIKWMGASWKVSSIDVQKPRLTLFIGGLYNG